MQHFLLFDPNLTKQDQLVLESLSNDIRDHDRSKTITERTTSPNAKISPNLQDEASISVLEAMNNPQEGRFEPTIFTSLDYQDLQWKPIKHLLQLYAQFTQSIVRFPTDVVMITHLLLYLTTSLPSAVLLFWNFTWLHGILHLFMQLYFLGPYTLMMHQHIHMRGILHKDYALVDRLFPYVLDPLMGHTWNSYFYHHVRHHHVEGNSPGDLSSTVRFQRDNVWHFLCYVARFQFLIWLDLPCYFIRRRQYWAATKLTFWYHIQLLAMYYCYNTCARATTVTFIIPMLAFRTAAMVGNWGQHAFINMEEPESDYRSSITLIDVSSNRLSFNDGYHTSHHLNPMRHWRDHPVAFLKNKEIYASQQALVFHNIDYLMITVKLLLKDYPHLAKCMVPIGEAQMVMSLDERVAFLKDHTRQFTEEEVATKFKGSSKLHII